jgi:DNA-directed RNA polymerase specialized sigma24 family protein
MVAGIEIAASAIYYARSEETLPTNSSADRDPFGKRASRLYAGVGRETVSDSKALGIDSVSNPLDSTLREDSDFPSTRWSLVMGAGLRSDPEAPEALAKLCKAYWYPIYAFIRRKGNDPELALDLTQAYFARLLEKGVIAAADPSKGRFRSFLRTDCQHFLVDGHRRDVVKKGGAAHVSIDTRDAEGRYRYERVDAMTPDRLFDRVWAKTLLGRAYKLLADEYVAKGRSDVFDRLESILTEGRGAVPTATLAAHLGTSEGAVNVAIHRLKKRFRELLEEQIAETIDDPSELDDEIRSLFDALGS